LRTLTTVRRLTAEEAALGYPVKLQGTRTFRDGGWRAFLQIETAGIFLPGPYPARTQESPFGPGTRVEVTGQTVPGRFVPFIRGVDGQPLQFTRLGQGPMPVPQRLTADQLNDSLNHCRYIEIGGVVRAVSVEQKPKLAEQVISVSIGRGDVRFTAGLHGDNMTAKMPPGFIGSTVSIRGVFGSLFNDRRQFTGMQLFVSAFKDFKIEKQGPLAPFTDLPLRPVASLMQFTGDNSSAALARISGIVTRTQPGEGVYLDSDGHGIRVENPAISGLLPGETVQVVGFPAWGNWNPVLRDAIWQHAETPAATPPVTPVTGRQALSGEFDSRLVELEALVLDNSPPGTEPALMLRHEDKAFLLRFTTPSGAGGTEHLQTGSLVKVRGICLNQRSPAPSVAALSSSDNEINSQPLGFEILSSTAADITLLRPPAWWTRERILTLLGLAAALALAALAWGISLRRRVAAQTILIREKLSRETLLEERTRMARELHDTLEQELMGLSLQLDAASDTLPTSPETARRALTSAQGLLKHTRSETRRSIWDLRASVLETSDLSTAIREVVAPLRTREAPDISVEVVGAARRLPPRIEANLLRIATEAVTNAVKHAAATRIAVTLTFHPDEIILLIHDDGCGLDAARAMSLQEGHYGLLGIRERTERLGGRLDLTASPTAGTVITVRVPLSSLAAIYAP
jgi:signal transduction histidine kinase